MAFYGRLFLVCRAVVRVVTPTYHVLHAERMQEPAIYLCRHSDLMGIFMTLPWLPMPVHTWGLHVFCEAKLCYRHLRDVTFVGRFHWPKWAATVAAGLVSGGLAALVRSARVIPVYRGSAQVIRTFRLSVEALRRGESLLIFPDKEYTNTGAGVSDLYEGFLRLDRFYFRVTERHIPFIPLYGDRRRRTLTVHEALRLTNGSDQGEIREMVRTLKARLSGYAAETYAGHALE